MSETPGPASARTRVRRLGERGRYDEATVHAILDEGIIAHVGVVTERGPVVLPTAYARLGRTLYLHGAVGNALLRAAEGAPVCATVTLLDGLVLAKSAFHHSMNYRSVVVFTTGRRVDDEDERRLALDAIVEHIVPGRTSEARPPNPSELRATRVLALDLAEASAKVRTGPPGRRRLAGLDRRHPCRHGAGHAGTDRRRTRLRPDPGPLATVSSLAAGPDLRSGRSGGGGTTGPQSASAAPRGGRRSDTAGQWAGTQQATLDEVLLPVGEAELHPGDAPPQLAVTGLTDDVGRC